MEDSFVYQRMAQHRDLFGDGNAGRRIAAILMEQGSEMTMVVPTADAPMMRAA
jgi:UDP-N-acetylglucosamine 2-epimerase